MSLIGLRSFILILYVKTFSALFIVRQRRREIETWEKPNRDKPDGREGKTFIGSYQISFQTITKLSSEHFYAPAMTSGILNFFIRKIMGMIIWTAANINQYEKTFYNKSTKAMKKK